MLYAFIIKNRPGKARLEHVIKYSHRRKTKKRRFEQKDVTEADKLESLNGWMYECSAELYVRLSSFTSLKSKDNKDYNAGNFEEGSFVLWHTQKKLMDCVKPKKDFLCKKYSG